MKRRSAIVSALICVAAVWIAGSVFAKQATQRGPVLVAEIQRPPLFFREDWKHRPNGPGNKFISEGDATPASVANPNLELKLYGVPFGRDPKLGWILETKKDTPDEPTHLFTGNCFVPCLIGLRHKTSNVDLSGLAKIRFLNKSAGFHFLRPVVKLSNGTWLVGDHTDTAKVDWHVSEISFMDLRWLPLDINKVVTKGNWVDKPDLTNVEEVGFVDLIPGGGSGYSAYSDLAWVEVYGNPAKRVAASEGK